MKTIIIISLFFLVSCGQDITSNKSNTQNALNAIQKGTLSFPLPGNIGGVPTIKFNNIDYQIDVTRSSPAVQSLINSLWTNPDAIEPISGSHLINNYPVQFSGELTSGKCVTNPSAQCPLAILQSLNSY